MSHDSFIQHVWRGGDCSQISLHFTHSLSPTHTHTHLTMVLVDLTQKHLCGREGICRITYKCCRGSLSFSHHYSKLIRSYELFISMQQQHLVIFHFSENFLLVPQVHTTRTMTSEITKLLDQSIKVESMLF